MAHAKNHDYHILSPSIWPLLGALFGFVMLSGAVAWMHEITPFIFLIGLVGTLYTMFAWWSEVVEESKVGDHTPVVQMSRSSRNRLLRRHRKPIRDGSASSSIVAPARQASPRLILPSVFRRVQWVNSTVRYGARQDSQ